MSVIKTEQFKPIPVRSYKGAIGSLLQSLRLVVDLQYLTCTQFLKPRLANVKGPVLDVGCGEMPFRSMLPVNVEYTGVDIPEAKVFGMRRNHDIVAFDGRNIPFPDASYSTILCTEVLEHAVDPVRLVAEMHRVLQSGGILMATVPFSARVHHAPYDFHRFTRFRLVEMFSSFKKVEIIERGNDISSISNKLIVICMRHARPKNIQDRLWMLAVLTLLVPITMIALGCAHISLIAGGGSKDDPLGYSIIAHKE